MNFLYKLFRLTKQFEFVEDKNGLHQFGGDIPNDFKVPENEFLGGLQYLGYINDKDKEFEWLSTKLHLVSPIFTDFDYILVDYESPLQPKLMYPTNSGDITSAYDEITKESYIIYDKANFSLRPFKGLNANNDFDVIAIAGKPYWTQKSSAPVCPKSGKTMRFVCQLLSNSPIKAKEKNFSSDRPYYEELFTELNFWCDGDLKVFFEPTSRVACYFIQNT